MKTALLMFCLLSSGCGILTSVKCMDCPDSATCAPVKLWVFTI